MKYSSILVGTVMLAGLMGVIFLFWQSNKDGKNGINAIENSATSTKFSQSRHDIPEGWREYRSEQYRLSLLYPEELAGKEFDEGGGAETIIFENAEKGLGFQIFIVPYGEEKISEERFRRDVPSGVRKDVENAMVDGATAAAFNSSNATLGDTREIWFIKNGFLYEVTAPRALGEWLNEIMSTWKFI